MRVYMQMLWREFYVVITPVTLVDRKNSYIYV